METHDKDPRISGPGQGRLGGRGIARDCLAAHRAYVNRPWPKHARCVGSVQGGAVLFFSDLALPRGGESPAGSPGLVPSSPTSLSERDETCNKAVKCFMTFPL